MSLQNKKGKLQNIYDEIYEEELGKKWLTQLKMLMQQINIEKIGN